MGYFVAGILLDGNPDWSRLESLPEQIGLRGYKHRENGICLLDFWPAHTQRNFSPFTAGREFAEIAKLPANAVVEKFEQHSRTIKNGVDIVYGSGWLRLVQAIAAAVEVPAFLFASDDEQYDFASLASPKAVERIACRFGTYDLYYNNRTWKVTPRLHLEDADDFRAKESDPILGLLKHSLVEINGELKIEGGDRLCEHPVTEWPKHLGDPVALLGLGTFDPLLDFDKTFGAVFERAPSKTQPSASVPAQAPGEPAQKSVNIDFIVQKYLAGRKQFKFGPFKPISGGKANEKILFSTDADGCQLYASNARLILMPGKRFGFLPGSGRTQSAWWCDLQEIPREIARDSQGKAGLSFKFQGRDEWTIFATGEEAKALSSAKEVFRWIHGQHGHRPADFARIGLEHSPHCTAAAKD